MNTKRLKGMLSICLALVIFWVTMSTPAYAAEVVVLNGADVSEYDASYSNDITFNVEKTGAVYEACYRILNSNDDGQQVFPRNAEEAQARVANIYYTVSPFTIPADHYVSLNLRNDMNLLSCSGSIMQMIDSNYQIRNQGEEIHYVKCYTIYVPFREYRIIYNIPNGEGGFEENDYGSTFYYGLDGYLLPIDDCGYDVPEDSYFAGWSLQPNGSVVYAPEAVLREPNAQSIVVDNITMTKLYAVVRPNSELVEQPPAAEPKAAGSASVSMANYYVGNTSVTPSVSSTTNDAAKAVISYKLASAPDSAFSSARPTEPGDYVVKAVLPESTTNIAATAFCSFRISYLPFPKSGVSIGASIGNRGEGDVLWYTSEGSIKAPDGYRISKSLNGNFTNGFPLEEGKNTFNIYYMNSLGEKTSAQNSSFWMDSTKPKMLEILSAEKKELSGTEGKYAYYGDNITFTVSDSYLASASLNGEALTGTPSKDLSSDEKQFSFELGKRMQVYDIVLTDEAGNQEKQTLTAGPSWLMTGVIPKGDVYLESNTQYQLNAGKWMISGDQNIYNGGGCVYTATEGDYRFDNK